MNFQNKIMECVSIALFIAAGVIYLISAHTQDNAAVFEVNGGNEPRAVASSGLEAEERQGSQTLSGNDRETDSTGLYRDAGRNAVKSDIDDGKGSSGNSYTDDGSETAGSSEAGTALIDINTADEAGLMTLPGIGQTRAAAIIEYRNSYGKFERIEDIMQVSGIKEGIFSKIKDLITVD